MENFKVQFSVSPWLLLLIIPFLVLTFFLYLRMEKRYRKSKNRILSMILHTIVSILCVILLSGMFFSWEIKNVENELCILVDASYSEQQANSRINSFVKEILDSNIGRSNIAIVTFGYDQKIVLSMDSHDPESAYRAYLDAELPNTSATDIAAALKFVYDPTTGESGGASGEAIIHYPESARILLISDGLETDEDALSVTRRICMKGIHVDTSFFPSSGVAPDVWITSVTQPNRMFSVGESFEYSLDLRSNFEGEVSYALCDNDVTAYEGTASLVLGEQVVRIPHAFTAPGHHELKFTILSEGDGLTNNNVYYSYYDLEEHSKLLIIEKYADESKEIVDILRQNNSDEELAIEVVQVGNHDKLPSSLEMMQEYDEIVLDNIAYSDMPEGFEENLHKYVNECGGGLFTVGGVARDDSGQVIMTNSDDPVPLAHSYQKEDMDNSKYFKRMLPVEAADFTPPVALVIIIDCSGSMADEIGGFSLIDYAVQGAIGCLDILSPRDYVGVMMMEDSYKVGLDMTPMSQKNKIITAIRRIAEEGGGGGTYYASSIEHAGRALSTVDVERKHILLISDGQPGDTLNPSDEFAGYGNVMERYHKNAGVTISVVSIGTPISSDLTKLAEIGEGSAIMVARQEMDQLKTIVKDNIFVTDISGAIPKDFHPSISNRTPILENITQSALNEITMNGFFATHAKSSGDILVTLMADSVPLYAQWSYGSGKVGSFMCDLSGYWSKSFLEKEEVGQKIVNNIIKDLIPSIDIRAHTLDASFIEDNYHTQVSIFGYTQKDEPNSKLVAIIEPPGSSEPFKYDLSEESVTGNRFTFRNEEPGVYRVTILKVSDRFDIDNSAYHSWEDIPNSQIQAILQTYRVFSYSQEYDPAMDAFSTGKDLLIKMSSREVESGNAEEKLIEDPDEFMSVFMNVTKTWDPRLWILGITIVLFLVDVAVRKFKFRKPHELFKHDEGRNLQ